MVYECYILIAEAFYLKKDEINWLVTSSKIDIACLSETWLSETVSNDEINITGYNCVRKDRIGKSGGGVAIFIKQHIPFKQRHDIITNDSLEMVWIELLRKQKTKNTLISCTYRPPNADVDYMNNITDTIEKAASENKDMVLMGDLNINYKIDEDLYKNHIFLLEQLFDMTQLIKDPTRVTSTSSSLIDIILTTCPSQHSGPGVYKSALSDHYLIYTELDIDYKEQSHNEVRYRDFKNFNPENFLQECKLLQDNFVMKYDVTNIDNIDVPHEELDELWNNWKIDFLTLSDKHAPFKLSRLKNRRNKWITPDVVQLIYKRDYLHSKAIKSNDVCRQNEFWKSYRNMRNHVTKTIKKLKLQHYNNITDNHKNRPKKFWKELKNVFPTKSKQKVPDISPDEFNHFFANIGTKVAQTISDTKSYNCTLPNSIHQFSFHEVPTTVIRKLLGTLSLDSKNDIFNFDTKLLRIASDIISPSITFLINLSLKIGYCPLDWKLARVSPAYKDKGDFLDKNNYRPLSVIGHIALLAEKCVQKQLLDYLISHKFISIDQFAYLAKHSTQTCLHRLIDDILENKNEKEITALCFLDIKKCFDTINHSILLTKLQRYGIRNNELKWCVSYLQSRQQLVTCNNKISSKKNVTIGVPQGTVLGPILFLLFVNDLSNVITEANINIYADDVVIYSSGSDIMSLKDNMQRVMNKVYNWYKINKLVLSATL